MLINKPDYFRHGIMLCIVLFLLGSFWYRTPNMKDQLEIVGVTLLASAYIIFTVVGEFRIYILQQQVRILKRQVGIQEFIEENYEERYDDVEELDEQKP
jgi:TRAP-type C4-dicarboxylate transport system permease small subunit